MSDNIKLEGTMLNAPDALELAQFYAEITGGVASGTSHWAFITGPNGSLTFQQVDDFEPPQWPGTDMRMHLDFLVDDLTTTGARVTAAGAKLHPNQPNANHCHVYTDPAGHLFCLSTWDTATAGNGG